MLPALIATALVRVLASSAWVSFTMYQLMPSFGPSEARVVGCYFAGVVLFESGLITAAWLMRDARRVR